VNTESSQLPRILIIDDLFGRTLAGSRNEERASLCGTYLLKDVTGDEGPTASQVIKQPLAEVVFCRGQTPTSSGLGDWVENDLEEALAAVRAGWQWRTDNRRWALVLLDLCFYTGRVTQESDTATAGMPEGLPADDDPARYFGLELLRAIHSEFPEIPIVILSSKPRHEVSREFSESGALGFLPRSEGQSPELLKEFIQRHGLLPDSSGEIVGHSVPLLMALRSARRAAADRRNILIRGERGTGKELLARYVHRCSATGQKCPYVIVDSGTLAPQLYASELFGHRRGAFTGADRDHRGRIQMADHGDLFLDEIGNIPPDVQIGLLRVLEQREVVPIGAVVGEKVDVRFLSATNEDLEGKTARGEFRQDLLDRLSDGGTLVLPPLRDRSEDFDELVERFVRDAERDHPGALYRQIEPDAVDRIKSYSWPGNIRELRSSISTAIAEYPDVEHFVSRHLRFGEPVVHAQISRTVSAGVHVATPSGGIESPTSLTALVRLLQQFDHTNIRASDLAGQLAPIEAAHARFLSQILRAAIEATRRRTPDNPEGQIRIHPAVKLLLGDKSVTASKAADIVKKLLNQCAESEEIRMGDPVLNSAYDIAVRLRPSKPKPSTHQNRTEDDTAKPDDPSS
jgi:two-component system response regulator GlrR